ncbi:hypothetical protein DFH11DRAFT_1746451 [Phellopilus nigrolimitatus]|nr:hypothetical protein DFH11DRAFT_1746451 [Phellopilus nigrolimitatus]
MRRFRAVLSKLKIKKRSLSSTSKTLVAVTNTSTPPVAVNERSEEKKSKAKTIVRETAEFLYVGIGALADSADAFPPLKSAVGGLKHIVDLLLRLKADKKDTVRLLERIDEMCELLEKAIPDVTNMSASFQTAVIELDFELSAIARDTERGAKKTFLKRLIYLRRHEGELSGLREMLEDARNNFELNVQLNMARGIRDIQCVLARAHERKPSELINAQAYGSYGSYRRRWRGKNFASCLIWNSIPIHLREPTNILQGAASQFNLMQNDHSKCRNTT